MTTEEFAIEAKELLIEHVKGEYFGHGNRPPFFIAYDKEEEVFITDSNITGSSKDFIIVFENDGNSEEDFTLSQHINEMEHEFQTQYPQYSEIKDLEELYKTDEDWFDESFDSWWRYEEEKIIRKITDEYSDYLIKKYNNKTLPFVGKQVWLSDLMCTVDYCSDDECNQITQDVAHNEHFTIHTEDIEVKVDIDFNVIEESIHNESEEIEERFNEYDYLIKLKSVNTYLNN
jgi:hypothetical protein